MRTPCNWTASGLSPNLVSASTSWLTSLAFFIASLPLITDEPFTVTYKFACEAKISSRWEAETLIVSGLDSIFPLFHHCKEIPSDTLHLRASTKRLNPLLGRTHPRNNIKLSYCQLSMWILFVTSFFDYFTDSIKAFPDVD